MNSTPSCRRSRVSRSTESKDRPCSSLPWWLPSIGTRCRQALAECMAMNHPYRTASDEQRPRGRLYLLSAPLGQSVLRTPPGSVGRTASGLVLLATTTDRRRVWGDSRAGAECTHGLSAADDIAAPDRVSRFRQLGHGLRAPEDLCRLPPCPHHGRQTLRWPELAQAMGPHRGMRSQESNGRTAQSMCQSVSPACPQRSASESINVSSSGGPPGPRAG